MISFFYEGDLNKLGGGVVIEKRIRKTPVSTDFLCDLYLDKKKYPARIHFPKYGGYEVRDIYEGKDEALRVFLDKIKSEGILYQFYLRWILKAVLSIMAVVLPVFTFLLFKSLGLFEKGIAVFALIAFEALIYLLGGVLNRI